MSFHFNFKKYSPTTVVNLLLLLMVIIGLFIDDNELSHILKTLGLYGLSGSLTNSLAIIMIFERIPGIVGSGIIEKNFNSFKKKLKETLVSHLFFGGLELQSINIDLISQQIYSKVQSSRLGFVAQFISQEQLKDLLESVELPKLLTEAISSDDLEKILEKQIEKLKPIQVKDLIRNIIAEHLQWLVLWGAIFGIIFGVISLIL